MLAATLLAVASLDMAHAQVATLSDVSPVQRLTATTNSQAGPKISRVVGYRPQAIFERVEHPAAAAGRKLVVVEIPPALGPAFEKNELYVAVIFSVPRATDSCNEVKIYGLVTEKPVNIVGELKYGVLEVRPSRISRTLKDCGPAPTQVRQVEVVTELKGPRPFRDTLVFDVPTEVSVEANFWSPIASAVGVTAD